MTNKELQIELRKYPEESEIYILVDSIDNNSSGMLNTVEYDDFNTYHNKPIIDLICNID